MPCQTDPFSMDGLNTPIDDHLYKLVNREPVRCNFAEYIQSMQDESQRIVAQTNVGELLISTIFTGIDHSFGKGKKALYEMMIFGMPEELHPKWQYATWDEATQAHHELVDSLSRNGVDSLIQEIKSKLKE